MLLKGSQRGGARQLALHLLNTKDNEEVEFHRLNGFVADDLEGALSEIHAISRATKCKQFMFSLSLSPPKGAVFCKSEYEAAIAEAAKRLGLDGQPYAIVFHTKDGRHHAHAVFSRIDGERLTAINLSFYKERLNELAHELYLQHGWDVPEGFKDRERSDPLNYGLEENQAAKRAGRDPKDIKARILTCWERSDSAAAFAAALKEHGFELCRGTRRGFVLLDRAGNIYSLSRWLGVKPKDLRARLGEPASWPGVDERQATQEPKLQAEAAKSQPNPNDELAKKLAPLQRQLERMAQRHDQELAALSTRQTERALAEQRMSGGLKRLWNWLVGSSAGVKQTPSAMAIDAAERDELAMRHKAERREISRKIEKLERIAKTPKISAEFEDIAFGPTAEEIKQYRERKARVQKDPAQVLDILTENKAAFTRSDIARTLHKYIDDPQVFVAALAKATTSPELVELSRKADETKPRYSTKAMVALEADLIGTACKLAGNASHQTKSRHVEAALARIIHEGRETGLLGRAYCWRP